MFSQQTLVALAASIAAAEAAVKGFNYGSTNTAGDALTESDFAALFTRAQNLQGTSGFTNARLYTMIQADTTNTPIEAISAAMSTNTDLLLGMWASAGQSDFDNEIAALKAAISTYGTAFTDRVTGLSVGSEDLYRDSVTGVQNNDGVGAGPATLVSYISQVKSALAGTALEGVSIGHVDTWDAWTNSSNSAVIGAVDWLGVDSYPYFETTVANAIGAEAKTAFFNSYDATEGVAGGKPVWITETGWPVSGPTSGQAVASVANAETYWQDVGCEILGDINTWWYTLEDAMPTTPSPSFGIIGSDLSSAPLYNLSCKNSTSPSTSSSSSTSSSHSSTTKSPGKTSSTTKKPAVTSPAVKTSVGGNGSVPVTTSTGSAPITSSVAVNGSTPATTSTSYSTVSSSAPPSSSTAPTTNGAGMLSSRSAVGAGLLAAVGLFFAQ